MKDTGGFTDELIKPILACMQDQDLRVRYYACESLYNVVKVSRGAILPHFSAIFNALSKIATDPEQNVKNASELLDRLLKVSISMIVIHIYFVYFYSILGYSCRKYII